MLKKTVSSYNNVLYTFPLPLLTVILPSDEHQATIFPTTQISSINYIGKPGNGVRSMGVVAQRVNDIHHELNVSGLKDGLYFIQVFTDRDVITLRVQVVK